MPSPGAPVKQAIAPKKARFPDTDTAMAEAFAAKRGHELVYITELRKWRVWTGQTWADDAHGAQVRNAIQRFVEKLPCRTETAQRVQKQYLSATKIGHVELRLRDKLFGSVHDFDCDPNLVNCLNGTLDVSTGEFFEHEPTDYLTNMMHVEYDAAVLPAEWDRWLRVTIREADVIEALQTIMGYGVFVAGNPERLLVLLKGPTSTGKSTFLEAISTLLGEWSKTFNLTIFRAKQGESARPDIVSVLDARIIHTSEASHEWDLHADQIKRFVGGDTMTTRKLYGEMYEKLPQCLPIIATNEIPSIKGADAALYQRMVAVPFAHQIARSKRKGNLATVFATRYGSEILQWLLEGYWRYKQEGLTSARKTLQVTTNRAFAETSIYAQFLAECTRKSVGAVVSNNEISSAFSGWLMRTEQSSTSIDPRELGKRLSALEWRAGKIDRNTRGRFDRKLITR